MKEKIILNGVLRISINEKHFNKLEESVLRIERLRPQFVKVPEVDALAELVVEESRNWEDIQEKFDILTRTWNSVSSDCDSNSRF